MTIVSRSLGAGVLAGFLLLAGCASHVEPEVRTVRVEVPVQVPCRAPEVAVPAWAATSLRKTDSLEVKVRAVGGAAAADRVRAGDRAAACR